MTTRPVAANTLLVSVKKQAKALLKSVRSGEPSSLARIAPYFSDLSVVGLQDIHLVIARERGFSSWAKLKAHLEEPFRQDDREQLANRFLSLVTVSYFSHIAPDPHRFVQAAALLDLHPEIADENIHVAAAIGDAMRVSRWLDEKPHLLDRKGGPYDWSPLLYASYARLPERSSLPAGQVLIARGADPDAFFLADGQYRFTALTGVFGEGEAGKVRQPAHPDFRLFAKLLLDAGATANDSQALYNRMFEPDNACLELLLEYGLSPRDTNNWLVREDGDLVANTQTVFDYQLAWALQNGMPDRVRLLVERGADVTRPVRGRTPYEWARLGGNDDLASYLVSKGAVAVSLQPEDWAAIQIADESVPIDRVKLLIESTTSVAAIRRRHPAMLHEAAGNNDLPKVRRMLALGFDVNTMRSRTPLHEAALHGHLEMARLLIENGADTTIREPHHYAPPIGWAEYNGRTEMVQLLMEMPLDIFAAAAYGRIDQLKAILDADAGMLEARFIDHRPAGEAEPGRDWLTPLGFAILNQRIETIRFLLAQGAERKVSDGAGRSYRNLAEETGNADIIALIAAPSSTK